MEKAGYENREKHIFHHSLTQAVISVNFGRVSTADNGSAPLRLCVEGER